MSNIVILQGHPDPDKKHLCHALSDAYVDGANSANHHVKKFTIAELKFPFLQTNESWLKGKADTPEDLKQVQNALDESDHIVIIYPLWLGTMPAIVKGFLEQLLRPGFAISYEKGLPQGLLKNKTAHIIITMGMPGFIYRFYFFSHSLRSLKRNILNLIGIKKIKTTLFGSVENNNAAQKEKWFEKIKKHGKNAT